MIDCMDTDNTLEMQKSCELLAVQVRLFARRMEVLNASGCGECCGEQISPVQGHILFEIARVGIPSMQQVADELGVDITTFSRQVKGLVEKGLVERQQSADDRRVTLLVLTAQGAELLARINGFMSAGISRILSDMTPFEQETVTRSLGLLNGAMVRAGLCCGP